MNINGYISEVCLEFSDIWLTQQKFTNLEEVAINYNYLSNKLFQHWAVSLSGSLKSLRVKYEDDERHRKYLNRQAPFDSWLFPLEYIMGINFLKVREVRTARWGRSLEQL